MSTKIIAARLATAAGVTTIITRSSNPGNLVNIVRYLQLLKASSRSASNTPPLGQRAIENGQAESLSQSLAAVTVTPANIPLHTRFIPSEPPIRDRYFWLLHGLAPHGTIYIDAGAQRALVNKSGLLPVGVVDVEGNFAQQEAVRLVVVNRIPAASRSSSGGRLWDGTPVEVGRALVNYSAAEIARIKGVQSTEITGLLGYADSEYVALRENISFFKRESRPVTPTGLPILEY
jgi:glutamate 5-kinase